MLSRTTKNLNVAVGSLSRIVPVHRPLIEEALLSVIRDSEVKSNIRRDAARAFAVQTGLEGVARIADELNDSLLTAAIRRLPADEKTTEFVIGLDPLEYPGTMKAAVQLFYRDRSALERLAMSDLGPVRAEAERLITKLDSYVEPAPADPSADVARLLAARATKILEASRLARSDDGDDQIEAVRLIAEVGAFELLPELADLTWSQHLRVRHHARAVANAMLTSPGPSASVESRQKGQDVRPDVFARILGDFSRGVSQSK